MANYYLERACKYLLSLLSSILSATEEEFPDRETYINVIEEIVDEVITMQTTIDVELARPGGEQ